jgi:S1-C subfamily serine protease
VPVEQIFPLPAPETIGLTLAPDHPARVTAVRPGTPAAEAGLRAGDDLAALNGQPLLSIADFAWALHHTGDPGQVRADVRRDGAARTVTLALPAGWRMKSEISRRVGTWSMRAMALGGMILADLDDAARAERGLDNRSLALLARGVGQNGKHATAKKAGFLKDDVIVAVDGRTERIGEGELIGRLLQTRKAGENVDVTVLRGGERRTLQLPMQ